MSKHLSKLWPDVSSPVARRVLTYLYKLPGCYTAGDFSERMPDIEADRRLHGLCDLWERIQGSDIASLVAGGPDLIPDIAEEMTGLNRLLYKLFRPRSLEQQTEGFIFNLEWYLAPHITRPRLHIPYRMQVNTVAFFSLYLVSQVFIGTGLSGYWMFMLLAAALLLYTFYWCYSRLFNLKVKGRTTFNARATVLYHYLRREYKDVE